ncbi:MAG: hypothetical protein A2Z57_06410 [Planctomycetes bacterium RIFCSPHIGHO2_12_39_6]|nr:MAG: hypothetical protein A2Z57_06410 [Planctomycetes bacterium RIFCSPHIGHO2_12_39_6]
MKNPNFKQTENEIKKATREYLELNGYEVYRINNGGGFRGFNKDGGKRFSFNGTPGVADLYAVKKGECPLWIETKKTGGKPTDDQYKFGVNINLSVGSLWFWSDSFDMFLRIFNDIKNGYGLPKEV